MKLNRFIEVLQTIAKHVGDDQPVHVIDKNNKRYEIMEVDFAGSGLQSSAEEIVIIMGKEAKFVDGTYPNED